MRQSNPSECSYCLKGVRLHLLHAALASSWHSDPAHFPAARPSACRARSPARARCAGGDGLTLHGCQTPECEFKSHHICIGEVLQEKYAEKDGANVYLCIRCAGSRGFLRGVCPSIVHLADQARVADEGALCGSTDADQRLGLAGGTPCALLKGRQECTAARRAEFFQPAAVQSG